ncbi:MAG TPA: hypothetical protein VFU23_02280 [Gemmatimonadales bacterium]|nr:hypothetical protein [Gemmatimonadales bacterium]
MADPRTQLRRVHSASLAPISTIAGQLLEVLGSRLASMVCDLRDPKALPRYAKGEQSPRSESEQRLRAVHQIVSTLMGGGLESVGVQAWFTAINPDLDDECPARLLQAGDPAASKRALYAARAFTEDYSALEPQPSETSSASAAKVVGPASKLIGG